MTHFWVNYCFKCFKIQNFYRFSLFNSIFLIYSHAVFIRHDAPRKHPNLGGYERTYKPPQEKQTLPGLSLSRCATVPEDFAQVQTALCEPSLYFQMQTKPQAHKFVRLSTYSLQA